MRITIDFDRCESHGLCALTAPEVFRIDDDGFTQYNAEPDPSERDNVVQAVRDCPVQAIRILAGGES
ncbi:ferredoxin [Saccharomonospora xinjiangensis]|uniref:Ferredoxin n=1 Tax=Saccharomonospora xinjiangensis XJ-54 TaxID=882086 RepID=I0UWY2_9PSEU|nr:ferredoxin [Saccharomonospora xinjiangensis]EID52385.1 ferredoxin [Saccharomonospora xinjiangensis XJ-54]